MTDECKNTWDVIINILTVFGAGIAFWFSLYQWRKGQEWQRAAKGRDLVDDLLKSADSDQEYYAWDAMKMLDYQDAKNSLLTKNIKGKKYGVTRDVIRQALTTDNSNESDEKLLYVRECFDELYFKLGQLQDAIDNKLVDLKHVSCPVDYYVSLIAKDATLHRDYLNNYSYARTLRFLENFSEWNDAFRK